MRLKVSRIHKTKLLSSDYLPKKEDTFQQLVCTNHLINSIGSFMFPIVYNFAYYFTGFSIPMDSGFELN
jgi:hypothetical protein